MKDIPGYEGLYSITEDGRVWSLPRVTNYGKDIRGLWKSLRLSIHGYPVVKLCKDGFIKLHKVHRLMALTYISNPLNLPVVNHKNGDKRDNRVGNLEWCTRDANVEHATRTGLIISGSEHHNIKLSDVQVEEIRSLFKKGGITKAKIARMFGVSGPTISNIISGKTRNTH